ncbi:hypothetical protein [uncultured Aquimarina sp.]|uniref:hypothetical protein n=1 Tax=uncultured Aquimarina sp. TaxID=575652 RepID=UPI00260FE30A|nr:hypothetical protein [uncultured Aquimarina sp.]
MKYIIIFGIIIFTGCYTSDEKENNITKKVIHNNNSVKKNAYEKMEVAFIGNPPKKKIKPILEKVMIFHGIEINETNLHRVGSTLIVLRKSSDKGISEMDILKHMNKNGARQISFPDQAAISLVLLEAKE